MWQMKSVFISNNHYILKTLLKDKDTSRREDKKQREGIHRIKVRYFFDELLPSCDEKIFYK
jgi:hypothetical protein